ncbi:hypothetical protein Tco_0581359 [Tanacetum coccineum]
MAIREPFVVNQDPDVSLRYDPPLINLIVVMSIRNLSKNLIYGEAKFEKRRKLTKKKSILLLPVTCDDKDDSIPLGDIIARYSTSKAITPNLSIKESENSLIMGDEPLSTIPATESDEVIKSSVENLVPIPSEFKGISDDTCDVPNYDDNHVHVESELVESLINRDTSMYYSFNIDPILEEFAGELAHIAPIPPELLRRFRIRHVDTLVMSIEPDQEGLISIDNSNDPLLELPEFESFHFDPSFLLPPPEPPAVYLDILYNDESFESGEGENIVVSNVEEDDSFTFTIRTFLPILNYPRGFLYLAPSRSEDHF